MLKKSVLLGALLVIGAVMLHPAHAGVPKVVTGEDITAQWCQYCPAATCGLETVKEEFGEQFAFWCLHVTDDPFTIPETTQRNNWYNVTGYPTVRIDGKTAVVGAGSCASAATQYRAAINARLNETGGIAPVSIVGSYLPTETEVSVQADFQLVDPATLVDLRASLVLIEDDVFWCCGFGGQSVWDHVVRRIYDQNISLTQVGDIVTVAAAIQTESDWNPANIRAVAYLQQTSGNKQMIQAAELPLVRDFEFAFEHLVRSVPTGNGVAVFNGSVTNTGDATDTITLEIGSSFPSWVTRFYVCGDSNPHSEPVDVTLDPGESCDIILQVLTDDVKEVRSGTFLTTSAFSGRTQTSNLRVYNGSHSILLVDDDYNRTDETKIVNALDNLGYLHEDWDCYNDHANLTPSPNDYSGYDIVIWHTGQGSTTGIAPDDDDMERLMDLMDAGGSLFLTSQKFLNTLSGANAFTTDYLGLSGWILDTKYTSIVGVGGDVIGDGLSMPLTYQFASWNSSDDVTPGPSAEVGMEGIDGSGALIHRDSGGSKCVFMATCFTALSDTDPDPNNTQVLLGRILDWLAPESPADAGDIDLHLATRIEAIQPNPFNPRTEISFSLSTASENGQVRLEIIDLAGRRVASLFKGQLPAGRHTETWTGVTDAGQPVESGVYFIHLSTPEGSSSEKLVLLK